MTKAQRGKYTPRHEKPHARIYDHWRRSAAWRSLTAQAKALYVEIAAQYRPDKENHFPLSNAEAARLIPCAPRTALKAIDQLVERGFFSLERPGRSWGPSSSRCRIVSVGIFETETREEDRDRPMKWKNPDGSKSGIQ